MIFAKKKILVWCDDPPEDRVISIVAGCLANHDRAHSPTYQGLYVSLAPRTTKDLSTFFLVILIDMRARGSKKKEISGQRKKKSVQKPILKMYRTQFWNKS